MRTTRSREPCTPQLPHTVVRLNVMLSLSRHMWSTLAVFVILAPSAAPAQTIANSFEELRTVLKKGQTIVVTDASGHRARGKVADVSPSSLVVLTPEARTFIRGSHWRWHRRSVEQGRQGRLSIASADAQPDPLATPWEGSAGSAGVGPFLMSRLVTTV